VVQRLILIGGSAGTGKTTLARDLARELGGGWLQLDTVWLAMKGEANRQSPASRALDIPSVIADPDRSDEEVIAAFVAASQVICRVLPEILAFELDAKPVLVADGAWLLPTFVANLTLPGTDIRSVFLHHVDTDAVADALAPRLEGRPLLDRHRLGNRRIWKCGERICDQARDHDLNVLDSLPFDTLTARVLQALGLPWIADQDSEKVARSG
jgi:2-phosphoglycerate kinase